VVFGGQLQWFPLRGLISSNWDTLSWGAKVVDYLWHIALPVTAMVLGSFAVTAMLTKNSFLEEIRKQYVLTARAKGLAEYLVIGKHTLQNSAIPIVTLAGLETGQLLGGAVITETIFAWPGLGRLTVQALLNRDFPVVLAAVSVISVTYTLINLAVDLLYAWLDPRTRREVAS